MRIKPNSQHLQQLTQALLNAFTHNELAIFTRQQFNQELEWITPVAGKRDLTTVVSELVSYFASQEGGLAQILAAALEENPENRSLTKLQNDWSDVEFACIDLPENHPAIQAESRGVAVGGDVIGSTIITGDGTVVIESSYDVKPPAPGESPYKGLQFFTEDDADLFFGREMLTAVLCIYLQTHSFLAVIGASGSGKSSLVRAGLVPVIQGNKPLVNGGAPPQDCEKWPIHIITPKAQPLKELATSLTKRGVLELAPSQLVKNFKDEPQSLALVVEQLLAASEADRLLLIIDQFEELFTLCRDPKERKVFVDNLLTAVTNDGPTIIVITLRADFYHHCGNFANLRNALEQHQRFIGPMDSKELRRAIEEPARLGGGF